ncbi:MAG: hypothetical protein Q8M76_12795, partial [Spirochaetaceae bacterium]|nr:hypothetical protein [Spirochaetaceae bacterium]
HGAPSRVKVLEPISRFGAPLYRRRAGNYSSAMMRMPLSGALEVASTRSSAIAAVYREAARKLLSRSISTLARSMEDQRRESGKELEALRSEFGSAIELDLDLADPDSLWGPIVPPAIEDAAALLTAMKRWESEDFELLAAIAGAAIAETALPASTDVAERVAALAEQARKRASWAQDHLDLLGISG